MDGLMENWEKKEISNTTISELTNMVSELAELNKVYDKVSSELKDVCDKIDKLEVKILEVLNDNNLPFFECNIGRVGIKNYSSVRVPDTIESKQKFFEYLKEQGLYDSMVTVNSKTLNAWFSRENEIREREGNFGWLPPGLSEPSNYQKLTFKKKGNI